MIVRQWFVHGKFNEGDRVCEIETDGVISVVTQARRMHGDYCGIYHYFSQVGSEVPPSGMLVEYGDSAGEHGLTGGRADRLHQSALRPLVRRRQYPRLFLSYRREDSEPWAWRLHEALGAAFGENDIFMDQFSIHPGEVFPWTIQQSAVHAQAMIVLIGPRWLDIAEQSGQRRLDTEWDYVLREICAALDRGTLVAPILLPGADVPERHQLPAVLEGLTQLQFFSLSKRHWKVDVGQLRDHLDGYFKDITDGTQ